MPYCFTNIIPSHIISNKNCTLITIIGAGGKTSLINILANEYVNQGKKVLVATSTKTFVDHTKLNIFEINVKNLQENLKQNFKKNNIIIVGKYIDNTNNKLIGLKKDKITRLKHLNLADIILCEGDGAARKALKAHALHEPVIPKETDFCIGVIGLDILGKPLSEVNVHRAELFSQVNNIPLGEKINPSHLIGHALNEMGFFKNYFNKKKQALFFNKVDLLPTNYNIDELFYNFKHIRQG